MIVKDMGGPNRNELDLKVVPGPLDWAVGTQGIIKLTVVVVVLVTPVIIAVSDPYGSSEGIET